MKIALIGASGQAGSRILQELSTRGFLITAIARHPEKIAPLDNVVPVKGDVFDKNALSAIIRGHDAVISAVHFTASDATLLIDAVRQSGVRRYVVVGGAGSLEIAPGQRLIDQPDFPEAYKAEAEKGAQFLGHLQATHDLDWTFISPSAMFIAGERSGKFRLGKDTLLTDENGNSSISFEDFAIALVDEIEKPRHIRQRFTVGY